MLLIMTIYDKSLQQAKEIMVLNKLLNESISFEHKHVKDANTKLIDLSTYRDPLFERKISFAQHIMRFPNLKSLEDL